MSGFSIEYATRIKTLPPYLFAAIDKMKQEAVARGVDIINLGIGDPDLPTPAPIIDSLAQAAKNPKHHQYPSYEGMLSFRKAVADWYKRRFSWYPVPVIRSIRSGRAFPVASRTSCRSRRRMAFFLI